MDTESLAEAESRLLNTSYAVATKVKYDQMWKWFIEFVLDLDLDISDQTVAKYVAYLYDHRQKYTSIQVHLAAIARGLEARGYPPHTRSFLVGRMLIGAKKLTLTKDIRQPFTEAHIIKMVTALQYIYPSNFEYWLYRAVITWAFSAGLRVSEYTQSRYADHNLYRSSIDMISVNDDIAYRITFRSFKSCPDEFPDFVLVRNENTILCPVTAMWNWLMVRPSGDGPLFVKHAEGNQPLKYRDIDQMLNRVCTLRTWNRTLFHTHSFRIGRATLWAQLGYTNEQIMHMGRWRSDAYKKYIRPSMVLLH